MRERLKKERKKKSQWVNERVVRRGRGRGGGKKETEKRKKKFGLIGVFSQAYQRERGGEESGKVEEGKKKKRQEGGDTRKRKEIKQNEKEAHFTVLESLENDYN